MSRRLMCILLACVLALPARAQDNMEFSYPEYYLQYIPHIAALALPVVGVDARSPFLDRVFELGIGYVSQSILVQGLKHTFYEQRPDGRSWNSFPSGHTATAFLGADLVRQQYGWGWGGGAYAVATSVAVLRVAHNRHWWWDVAAGAGIGILCANIGRWALDPVMEVLRINDRPGNRVALSPAVDPLSGTICTSLSVRF